MATIQFEDIISKFSVETATLATQLRQFIKKELKGISEIPDNKLSIIGYGFGTGYKDLICTMLISKSGVKLGLSHGADLPDPQGLLEGKGRVHKYIQIENEGILKNAALREMMNEALSAYKKRSN